MNPYTGLPEVEVCRSRSLEPDPCVVDAAPISRLLQEFVGSYRATRPSVRGRFTGDERGSVVEPMDPYEALSRDSGVPEQELRRLASGPRSRPYTELRVVDALAAAGVGEPAMLYDGTFTIRPNPSVPAELSRSCCGGSGF